MSTKHQRRTRNPILREKPILLGFVVQRKGADGRIHIAVRWGRIFTTLFVLFIASWIAVAGALYGYFKYNCAMAPGFVALELEAVDATHLQGGAKCRYCVRGPPGRLSEKVAVSAIILRAVEVPSIVRLT